MNYSILMADIIESKSYDSVQLMKDFKKIVKKANEKFSTSLISPLTITLGDEFQGITDNIENALKIILYMEEELIMLQLPFKLRYVLNWGQIDTPINKKMAYGMLGPGLSESREIINEQKRDNARFKIILKQPDKQQLLNDLFKIYQHYRDTWSQQDYSFVRLFLKHLNYKEVAKKMKINPSSAWRRKKSLNMEEYEISKTLILKLNLILHD